MNFYKNKLFKLIIIVFILFASLIMFLKNFVYKDNYISEINYIINRNNYNIDELLILSVIKNESKFNKEAISSKDAKGLMQILDNTYLDIDKNMDISNIYDASTNLYIGISYFNKLLLLYDNNIYLAIVSYNAGMGNVKKWIDKGIINYNFTIKDINKIPFNETKKYLKKVNFDYNIYKLIYK